MEVLLDSIISEQNAVVVLSLAFVVYLARIVKQKEEDRKDAWKSVNEMMKENNEVLGELSAAIKILYELEKDRINR